MKKVKEMLKKLLEKMKTTPPMVYVVTALAIILVAVSVLCLVLSDTGCSKKPETPPATTETTAAPETTETTVPATTEPQVLCHPLNGTPLEEPFTGRATAIVTPNDRPALPQYGIGNADILYEIEAEGGITRCLMIFSELGFEGKIGPIRSARTYFNSVAKSYDAPIVHCGGSPGGRKGHYSDSGKKIKNWAHIDEMANYGYFYRDSERSNAGYAFEYTLFTTGAKMIAALEALGYNTVNEEGTDYSLTFSPEPALPGGETANTVTIGFRGGKKTVMTLDAATGLYRAYQHGRDWIDGNTGRVLSFRNLIILQAEQWHDDSGYRTYYDLFVDEGKGLFVCDGKAVPIKWIREKLSHNFTYTFLDGTPVTLGEGKTYIAISSPKSTTTYE